MPSACTGSRETAAAASATTTRQAAHLLGIEFGPIALRMPDGIFPVGQRQLLAALAENHRLAARGSNIQTQIAHVRTSKVRQSF